MIVKSIMLRHELCLPLELEIKLLPGLPTIKFLGLPESGLKESELRIKSAIKSSGFQFPRGRQILVDIRPRGERKHGRGLDLAVALGFLKMTRQIEFENLEDMIIYGDLGLDGQVVAPDDWARVCKVYDGTMVTGLGPIDGKFSSGGGDKGLWQLSHLREVQGKTWLTPSREREHPAAADFSLQKDLQLEPRPARLAAIAAAGGHLTLIAGPQGSGKSTLARAIHLLRPQPGPAEVREIELWNGVAERPLVQVHHSASEIAMVGGRQPVRPGAITRAHCGTLLLDEVLLFKPEVQEALREPLELGFVELARGTEGRRLPANFQLLATANLCECGRWTPSSQESCTCPSRVRANYDARLRGPFVDRFQILVFSDQWHPSRGTVSLSEIAAKVSAAEAFQVQAGRPEANRWWRPHGVEPNLLKRLPKAGSERRRLSILRVARTIADLEGAKEIASAHLDEAVVLALDGFLLLQPTRD